MISKNFYLALTALSSFFAATTANAAPHYEFRVSSKGIVAAANLPSQAPLTNAPAQPVEPKAILRYVETGLNFGTVYTNGPSMVTMNLHIQNTGNALARDDDDTWEFYQIGAQQWQAVQVFVDNPNNTCYPNTYSFYLPAGQTCVLPVSLYNISKLAPGTYQTTAYINARAAAPNSKFEPVASIPVTFTVAQP
jgi:hypothetical protein